MGKICKMPVLRSNLTPLHVLVFTGTENILLAREEEKSEGKFRFIDIS